MKILFVNPTKKLRVGMINLINILSKNENELYILTPEKVKYPFRGKKNVKLIVYPSFFIPKIRYTIPIFLEQYSIIKNLIEKEKIDIIHCWSYFYPTNLIPLLLSKRYRIPIITTVDCFPGINWSYGSLFLVDLASKIYSKLVGKIVLKKMDKIVLMGKYLINSANMLGIKNYEVIPSSVDINKFDIKTKKGLKKKLGIKKDEIVLINIGRLVPVKGIEKLIKLTKALLDEGYKIKTLIVGNGPYEKKYKKLAEGIDEIIFTGHRKDIPEVLSISDIFILTSISEGFPNVLLEASAAGKPIVTNDVGGVSEIILDGITGFMVKDYKEMKTGIEKLIESKIMRKEFGKNSRKRIKKYFGNENSIKNYNKLYNNLRIYYEKN